MISRMSVASRISISPSIKTMDLNRFKDQFLSNSSLNEDTTSNKQPLFMPSTNNTTIRDIIPEDPYETESRHTRNRHAQSVSVVPISANKV